MSHRAMPGITFRNRMLADDGGYLLAAHRAMKTNSSC